MTQVRAVAATRRRAGYNTAIILRGHDKNGSGRNNEMLQGIIEITREQSDYKEGLKTIKQENQNMKKEIGNLYVKMEELEKDKKKKNLIIQGPDIEQIPNKNLKEEVEHFIEKNLNIKVALNTAGNLGKKRCLIQTENLSDKNEILKNKAKLKEVKEKIFIDADLTKKKREVQKYINTKNEGRKEK
ncbi:hypothetical protein ILUMI_21021 [Ignelater luminosus]|uniref:Uncharacterized protein n=1 Tax=Ignelater luminosus TaxID=2038154 RepID=A0A8K0CJN5_IGNLU|nr:hypothetical protein ILUMI_21021 [Ignelater luminosus]